MLCEHCHKKQAIMHMVCLIGDKQVEKWLCGDCATLFLPGGLGLSPNPFSPEQARRFFTDLIRGGSAPQKKVTKDGFTENAAKALELGASKALDMGCAHIGTEHILYGLLELKECTAKKILRKLHANVDEIAAELAGWLEKGEAKNAVPEYSPRAKLVLEQAGANARFLKQWYVGTEQLLLGLLIAGDGIASQVLRKFSITLDKVEDAVRALDERRKSVPGGHPQRPQLQDKQQDVLEMLSGYGRNLNQEAVNGRIDPVIGREKEVERIIQILCRRTKNNPVIIGEAGVGKTAVAEALAQKIVKG